MFYSPKKDIERYVTIKNQEINALKGQIHSEKITEQHLVIAKDKLLKLKNQYNLLLSQNHFELKKTLRANEQAKTSLQQQSSMKQKQVKVKFSQLQEMKSVKDQIKLKIAQAKERLRFKNQQKQDLRNQKSCLQKQILEMTSSSQSLRKQTEQLRQLETKGSKQLCSHQTKTQSQSLKLNELKKQASKLGMQLLQQRQRNRIQKNQHQIQQMKIENLTLKRNANTQIKARLSTEQSLMKVNFHMIKQRAELSKHQTTSAATMDLIVKKVTGIKNNKQKQLSAYQRDVKELIIKVQLEEHLNQERTNNISALNQKIVTAENSCKKIQQQLNSIYQNDSKIISILCSKRHENQQQKQWMKLQKQNKSPLDFGFGWSKLNSLDMAKTSDSDLVDV